MVDHATTADEDERQSLRPFFLSARFYERRFVPLMVLIFTLGTVLLVLSALTGESADLIVGDAEFYFEYARSFAVNGHLPQNQIRYPCGVAMIGSLGYLPSMGLTRIFQGFGWFISQPYQDGFGLLNQIAFCLPLILFSAFAVRINLSMLRILGLPDSASKPALLFWIVGTNIGYYFFKEPAMSESATYASVSLFYCLLLKSFHRPPGSNARLLLQRWASCVMIGMALGFAGTIRQQNILHALAVPIIVWPHARKVFPDRLFSATFYWIRSVGMVAVFSGLVFAIPYVVWAMGTQDLQVYAYAGGTFNFLSPRLFAVLFQPDKNGLFFWTPMFLLAVWGLVLFLTRNKNLLLVLLTPLFAQYYLIASWFWYSFGTSIGHRGFFTIFPILLVGLVQILTIAQKKGFGRLIIGTLALLSLINLTVLLLISSQIINVVH